MKLPHLPNIRISTATPAAVVAFSLVGVTASLSGQVFDVAFGTSNDGAGGFSPSAETGSETWDVEANNYNYAFGVLPPTGVETNDEGHTASLLRSVTLDRTPGSTYSVEGVLNLANGYGDDNNRIGILLFNDTATQTSDGGGGLYLTLNTDSSDDDIGIRDGINNANGNLGFTGTNVATTGTFSGDGWIGTTLTYNADIAFVGSDIEVDFTFTDQNAAETTTSATVAAADYTGTYFGFASKWRYRDQSSSNRDVPAEFEYQSFSIVPEPSSFALIAGGLAGLAIFRRRRS